jgi:hypothetical protein
MPDIVSAELKSYRYDIVKYRADTIIGADICMVCNFFLKKPRDLIYLTGIGLTTLEPKLLQASQLLKGDSDNITQFTLFYGTFLPPLHQLCI